METRQRSQWVDFLWKVPLIATIYFGGTMIAGTVVGALGLQLPELPGQEYRPALTYLGALVLAAGVAVLARGLRGSQAVRWLLLATFTYVAFCVNNQIEGAVFSTAGGFSSNLVFFLIPCALITGAAVLLIRAPQEDTALITVFKDRPVSAWWWRAVLAWVAFPFIYYFFGAFAYPLVADAYTGGELGLEVPSQALIVKAVFFRSLLFLLATIPIFFYWARSRRNLVLSLGIALAAMVGVTAMIESAWLPATVRIVHGVEITLDSLAHAWAMVALLAPRRHRGSDETAATPIDSASVE